MTAYFLACPKSWMAFTLWLLENIFQDHLCLTWLYYDIYIYYLDEGLATE